MSAAMNDASRIRSGVPSVEPPSELINTVRRRGKWRVKDSCTARTTVTTVEALFKVGSPTRMSTWPTAISCRSSPSDRVLSLSTRRLEDHERGLALARPGSETGSTSEGRASLEPAQPEPVKVVRPHHHDVRGRSDSRKDAAAEHLDRDGASQSRQVEFGDLRGAGEVADHEHRVASEGPRERQHAMVVGLEK